MADRPEFSHRRERHGVIGPFSGRQLVIAFAAVLVAVVVLVGVTTPLGNTATGPARSTRGRPPTSSRRRRRSGSRSARPRPSSPSTNADGTTYQLTDLDGKPIRLADLRGKAVWVNFWTTWCPPCQSEVPILREVSERYKDRGLVLVAISVQETSPADVAAYAARYQLAYTIGFDGAGAIFHAYKAYGLPTQVFIDPNGVIASIVGAPLDEAGAAAQIEAILPRGESLTLRPGERTAQAATFRWFAMRNHSCGRDRSSGIRIGRQQMAARIVPFAGTISRTASGRRLRSAGRTLPRRRRRGHWRRVIGS